MSTDLELMRTQFKGNIQFLINNERLEEAEVLLNEYYKMVPYDIETYSIKAVLLIMQQSIEEAEKILKEGLIYDCKNFDLNYNLAYVYEISGIYNEAIIYYKKARKIKYYDTKVKVQIDNILINIYQNKSDSIIAECNNNEIYLHLEKIKSVLFIDTNLSNKVNILAQNLDEYGIDIDLAYTGATPDTRFSAEELFFRKILGIVNLDDLINYINYYAYDIVHLFNVPNSIEEYIKDMCRSSIIVNNDLLNQGIINVLRFYSNEKTEKNLEPVNIPDKNVTIVIPTYNRPNYLQRVLDYFNNFQFLKPYIIVLDSSFENNKLLNETLISNLKNDSVSYYHFESSINFFTKLNYGICKVKTDYVALCADDDFLTEEGILESIAELEKDKELYSVKGKNLFFVENMSNLKEYDFFQGLFASTAVNRLQDIAKDFVPSLIYQVFRVDKFRNLYLFIEKHLDEFPENTTFQEYLFYFMVICTGKLGVINVDLNIRDKNVPREMEVKNFPHAVIEGIFNSDYKKFCLSLSKYLEAIGEDAKQFDKHISEIFSNFLINFLCVPKENVIMNNDIFDLEQLENGMRKSWVWPKIL